MNREKEVSCEHSDRRHSQPWGYGHAIGAVLHQHQMRVITNLRGRSVRSVALAKTAGFLDVTELPKHLTNCSI
jgi:hypothetical protein